MTLLRLSVRPECPPNRTPRRGLVHAAIALEEHKIPYEVRRSAQKLNEDYDSDQAARKVYLFVICESPKQETLINLLIGNYVLVEQVDSYGDALVPSEKQMAGWKSVYHYVLTEIRRGEIY